MAPKRKEPSRGRATSDEPDVHHVARRIRTGTSSRSFSQPTPSQAEDGSDELLNAHDPGPDIRLPQIFNFLRDADAMRVMDWEHKLKAVTRYLQNADRRRRAGDRRFSEAISKQLDLCFELIAIHCRYEQWNQGITPWSNDVLPKAHYAARLERYDRMLPAPPTQTDAEKLPKTHVSLAPRPYWRTHSPFYQSRFEADKSPDWDAFFEEDGINLIDELEQLRDDEEDLWANRASHENLSELENAAYERTLAERILPWTVRDAATAGATKKRPGSLRDFARMRGARRAVIQMILNTHFTNQENRNLNTPWRRVALPEPIPAKEEDGVRPDAVVIKNRNATDEGPKEALGCTEMEPSPWIYWYNKYAAQISMLAYWAREVIKKENWLDSKQIALPYNYQGPYIYTPKSIFDEHWYAMGAKCIGLQHNLARAAGKHEPGGRYLLERVTQDILAGVTNSPLPRGIMIRDDIDYNQKSRSFELVDETEIAWLTYLLRPGSSSGFVGYGDRTPQDNLLILFDHRLQTLYNDAYTDLFWAKNPAHRRDSAPTQYTSQKVPLTTLVDIINRGGRKLVREAGREVWRAADLDRNDAHPPNDLYQFSLEEARDASIKLARMGRLVYEGPPRHGEGEPEGGRHLSLYASDDAGDWGSVGVRKMEVWPEECIVWRHPSKASREKYNQVYKRTWVEYMLTQDRDARDSFDTTEPWPREHYERQFLPETAHATGMYAPDSDQARLQCPAFEDLVSFREAFEKQLGLCERTVQYFRIIGYRMGLTIRNFREVVARGHADPPPVPFDRSDLDYAVLLWEQSVIDGRRDGVSMTYLPFVASEPQEVIARSNPQHPDAASEDPTKVYTAIRRGIIDDCVKNRTMLYPCRVQVYTDARGRAGEAYERANLWGWADPTIRRHHAPYVRRHYFAVGRWPPNRQGAAAQAAARARRDEDPAVQPTLAWNRYGIRVGPRGPTDDFDLLRSLRPDQRPAARLLMQRFNEALVTMLRDDGDARPALRDTWRLTITPPRSAASWGGADAGPKLVPIVKQDSRFFPGPSSFPMGDTLLKELKVSQDIMDMMDPPSNTLGSRLLDKVTGWFAAEPERVPLFPAIDMNRAPRSSPLKRRLPPDFLTDIAPARKVVKLPAGRDDNDDDGPAPPGSTTVAVDLGPGGLTPPPAGPPPRSHRHEATAAAAPGVLKKAGAAAQPAKPAVSFNLPETRPGGPPHAAAAVDSLPAHHKPPARKPPVAARPPAILKTTGPKKPPFPQTMTPRSPLVEIALSAMPASTVPPPPPPSWNPTSPPRIPTPPLTTTTATTTGTMHPADELALRLLHEDFPGGWERIPVSASGLECGLRAVAASAGAQHARVRGPTAAELRAVFFGAGQQAANAEAAVANTNNFTADQLAGVLHRWRAANGANTNGAEGEGPRLHLGIVFDDRPPFVLWDDDGDGDRRPGPGAPRRPDDKIVWIHTDDHERRYDHERRPSDDAVVLSHYSGLRRKDGPPASSSD